MHPAAWLQHRVVRRGADIATSAVSRVSAVPPRGVSPRQPGSHDTKSAALDGQTDSGRRLAGHHQPSTVSPPCPPPAAPPPVPRAGPGLAAGAAAGWRQSEWCWRAERSCHPSHDTRHISHLAVPPRPPTRQHIWFGSSPVCSLRGQPPAAPSAASDVSLWWGCSPACLPAARPWPSRHRSSPTSPPDLTSASRPA